MPSPAPEPECKQTFELPRIVARTVDPRTFDVGRCSTGTDPQSLPRVVVPCVYVLRCQSPTGPFFYVGVSSDVVSRIGQHFAGAGSTLTRRYPPVAVEAIVYNAGKHDENEIVLQIARHFGSGGSESKFGPKVRGGRWACVGDVVPV